MKKFYAVFDTNVLVSSLMSKRDDSPTVVLLDYVLDGRIVLLYNLNLSLLNLLKPYESKME